jgi:outer membrane protein TolC
MIGRARDARRASSLDVEQARANREQTRATIPIFETGHAEAAHRIAVLTALEDVENALVFLANSRERESALNGAVEAARNACGWCATESPSRLP